MKNLMVRTHTLTRFAARLVAIVMFAALLYGPSLALAATSPTLGAADSYSVLAGSTVTNTGLTTVPGDLGVSPGIAFTGFPPGIVGPPGAIHAGDASAAAAQLANGAAFLALSAVPNVACDQDFGAVTDLAGQTLVPGVYCASAFTLSETLTLDDTGAPNGVWIFRSASTLITSSGVGARVQFLSGVGSPCNVWWQVGSSATIGVNTTFIGNILALTSITLQTNASLNGRALAQNGAVTMDTNGVTFCNSGGSGTLCGNGVINGSETCDDGNLLNGDGCSSICAVEAGFVCVDQPSVCTPIGPIPPVCGDGVIGVGETCDDSNTTSGDGCSSICTVEAGFECVGQPSVCTPAVCDLTVQKSCDQAAAPYACAKPITSLTMLWKGLNGDGVTHVRIAGTAGVTAFDIPDVAPSLPGAPDPVTVSGYNGSQGNDVFWNICQANSGGICDSANPAFIGQSSFHLSCSDVDMNSADDCGKLAGDNKGKTTCAGGPCINQWIFEGMNGPVGSPPSASLACPDVAGGVDQICDVTPTPYLCTKPIQQLTMQWNGGAPIPTEIKARVTSGGSVLSFPIGPTGTVTVAGYDGSLGNDVFWDIYDSTFTKIGQSSFHLSCSDADMNGPEDCGKTEGDNKGRTTCSPAPCVNLWTFIGMAGAGLTLDCANPGGTATVPYIIEVTNNTLTKVTGITLSDTATPPGATVPVDGTFDLEAGETKTFQFLDTIGQTTTDQATALACGAFFLSNVVTVNVATTPALCPTGAASLVIKGRDVSWDLTDLKDHQKPGIKDHQKSEIKDISVSWPTGNGVLQEVKLGAPKIFKGSLAPPLATINAFSGHPKDRQIDDGHKETLKFHFKNNAASGPYDITVDFTNGCSVHIAKP